MRRIELVLMVGFLIAWVFVCVVLLNELSTVRETVLSILTH